MIALNDDNFKAEVAIGQTVVLFWAGWAGPCKRAMETFAGLAKYDSSTMRWATFDLDDNPNTPHDYGIRGVPVFMKFEDGEPRASVMGDVPVESIQDIANVT